MHSIAFEDVDEENDKVDEIETYTKETEELEKPWEIKKSTAEALQESTQALHKERLTQNKREARRVYLKSIEQVIPYNSMALRKTEIKKYEELSRASKFNNDTL